jgi:hypothetical protein
MLLYVETVLPDGSICLTSHWYEYGCSGVVHEKYGNGVSFSNYNMNNIYDRNSDDNSVMNFIYR